MPLRGVIEGFYGTPWSMRDRMQYARWLAALGLNCYLYAPKADPFLRRAWSAHWPQSEWQALALLAAEYRRRGVLFGLGLSPFNLYADYGRSQRVRLQAKIERINSIGAPVLALLFDDMPGAQTDLAARQVDIILDCLEWSGAERLLVCPTYYSFDPVLERHFGRRPDHYWQDLGTLLPAEVDVFWTGDRVCAESLGSRDLQSINSHLQRDVTLWDNYPVNDGALRSRHLYLDAPPARDGADLSTSTRGHLCNGMNQAWLTLPAIAGLARLYDDSLDIESWLSAQLGTATLARLRRDAPRFRAETREAFLAIEGQAVIDDYLSLDSPAATETAAWLRGDYAFDPACLTD